MAEKHLSQEVILTLLAEPTFAECLELCFCEEELVKEFERIYKVTRPRLPRNGLEAMIDKATGYEDSQWREFLSAFITFVYDCVWTRLPVGVRSGA